MDRGHPLMMSEFFDCFWTPSLPHVRKYSNNVNLLSGVMFEFHETLPPPRFGHHLWMAPQPLYKTWGKHKNEWLYVINILFHFTKHQLHLARNAHTVSLLISLTKFRNFWGLFFCENKLWHGSWAKKKEKKGCLFEKFARAYSAARFGQEN